MLLLDLDIHFNNIGGKSLPFGFKPKLGFFFYIFLLALFLQLLLLAFVLGIFYFLILEKGILAKLLHNCVRGSVLTIIFYLHNWKRVSMAQWISGFNSIQLVSAQHEDQCQDHSRQVVLVSINS